MSTSSATHGVGISIKNWYLQGDPESQLDWEWWYIYIYIFNIYFLFVLRGFYISVLAKKRKSCVAGSALNWRASFADAQSVVN